MNLFRGVSGSHRSQSEVCFSNCCASNFLKIGSDFENLWFSWFSWFCDGVTRLPLTRRDSWKDEAWYWAYLMMVVWERLLSQRHIFLVPLGSQFSSVGWDSWVRTSTRWSGLASTSVFVENRPRSVWKKSHRSSIS